MLQILGKGREVQRDATGMGNWKAAAAPLAAWGCWKVGEMSTLAGDTEPLLEQDEQPTFL